MNATDTAEATGLHAPAQPHSGQLVANRYARRDFYLRRILVLSDLLCIAAALLATLAISRGELDPARVLYALLSAPGWVIVFKLYDLYERDAKRVSHTTLDDVPSLFHALLVGCLLEWLYFQVVGSGKLVFAQILLFAGIASVLVVVGRGSVRTLVARMVSAERVLVIGSGPGMRALVGKMRAHPKYRLDPIGIIPGPDPVEGLDLPLVGELGRDSLEDIVIAHRVGRVVVSDSELDESQLLTVLRDCKAASVKVSMLPAISSAIGPSVEVDDVGGITVLGINPPVLSRSSALAKRSMDVIGSALLLAVFGVPMLVLAGIVRLSSPGPAFFRQARIGKGGKVFTLVKLRTMVADAEERRRTLLSLSKDPGWLVLDVDPRVTPIGRFLRTTSLDELPQLWNVLKGEMSLVGPRPLIADDDSKVDAWARGRLDLTPGMTGLWQVLGRTTLPFEEMVRLDYLYVTNWTLWGDVRLLLRTLPAVLFRRGAN